MELKENPLLENDTFGKLKKMGDEKKRKEENRYFNIVKCYENYALGMSGKKHAYLWRKIIWRSTNIQRGIWQIT